MLSGSGRLNKIQLCSVLNYYQSFLKEFPRFSLSFAQNKQKFYSSTNDCITTKDISFSKKLFISKRSVNVYFCVHKRDFY